jgi:hypothetical protein
VAYCRFETAQACNTACAAKLQMDSKFIFIKRAYLVDELGRSMSNERSSETSESEEERPVGPRERTVLVGMRKVEIEIESDSRAEF